jgi:hypothetical protein
MWAALLKRSWPVSLVTVPCGAVYCLLLWLFPEALDALENLPSSLLWGQWGGIETLFLLDSLILGWASVVVLEHVLGMTGRVVLLIAVMSCIIAVGGGFALARVILGPLPGNPSEMVAYCIATTIVSAACRSWWSAVE